jgi:hypothetical protein
MSDEHVSTTMKDTTRSYRTLPDRSLINMALVGAGHIESMYLPTAKVLEELAFRYDALLSAAKEEVSDHE